MILRFASLIVLIFASACGTGCDRQSANIPVSVTDQDGSKSVPTLTEPQSFGEFEFQTPIGWHTVEPDLKKTKALLLPEGQTDWRIANAMIKVDIGNPSSLSARQLAEAFARGADGTVSEETVDFGGEPAVVVSTPSKDLSTPRQMFVIHREKTVYLIMAAASEGVDLSDALMQIRESWSWTEP